MCRFTVKHSNFKNFEDTLFFNVRNPSRVSIQFKTIFSYRKLLVPMSSNPTMINNFSQVTKKNFIIFLWHVSNGLNVTWTQWMTLLISHSLNLMIQFIVNEKKEEKLNGKLSFLSLFHSLPKLLFFYYWQQWIWNIFRTSS